MSLGNSPSVGIEPRQAQPLSPVPLPKPRKSQVIPCAFKNLPSQKGLGFSLQCQQRVTDPPTLSGAMLANLRKSFHYQDTKGWATQRATGCKGRGPGTLSPTQEDTMDPRIPAERDKKAEITVRQFAFVGAHGAQVKSKNKQRSTVTRVEESIAPAARFGEGNNKAQVWGGEVPSFPPVSMGGVLRLRALTIKESLGFFGHPTRQHDTLTRGGRTKGLGGLVFLAGGSKPRATAVGEREELQMAEGAVQLALGKQVGRQQAPRLGPWLPIL